MLHFSYGIAMVRVLGLTVRRRLATKLDRRIVGNRPMRGLLWVTRRRVKNSASRPCLNSVGLNGMTNCCRGVSVE